jgi:MFS family permease
MTPLEKRVSLTLAALVSLRILGLFLILPVFAIEARRYPGGEDPAFLGLAMGVYGLTQACLHVPLGWASDRWGRKKIIYLGLLVFAAGSLWAGFAQDVTQLLIGRGLQGAGAVSAALMALLSDFTRNEVRTKAMAIVGMSIGTMFATSLVLAPVLSSWIGLSGLFFLTAAFAALGLLMIWRLVPPEPAHKPMDEAVSQTSSISPNRLLLRPDLLRMNFGVFALHAVQVAMWVAVPGLLVHAGLLAADHWQVYLPAFWCSFLLLGVVFAFERRGFVRPVFLLAIGLIVFAQAGLMWHTLHSLNLWVLGLWLFVFFCGFNALEALQPSMVSKMVTSAQRGTAMGAYNTFQSLGFFAGGVVGGWAAKHFGSPALFAVCLVISVTWWVLVASTKRSPISGMDLHP